MSKGRDTMKRKLYGNAITPACEICRNGRRSSDGKVILCLRKGIMDLTDRCRKFEYDPLRRVPYAQPELQTYSEADFRLE